MRVTKTHCLALFTTILAAAACLAFAATAGAAGAAPKTKWVSVKSNGAEVNTDNEFASVDRNGKLITFESPGKFTGGDGSVFDVFVRNTETHKTTLVSSKANGKTIKGANSEESAISANGRFVAFVSDGAFSKQDTNGAGDVYVKDLKTGQITLASLDSKDKVTPEGAAEPAVSADGRFVAFQTDGTFVPKDDNGVTDIYVRDLEKGTTKLVSIQSDGQLSAIKSTGASISADGNRIAYASGDQSMTADTDGPPPTQSDEDAFVRDMKRHETIRASLRADGTEPYSGVNQNDSAVISGNGRYVAWATDFEGVYTGDDVASYADVYRKDLKTGGVTRISLKSDGFEVLGDAGAGSERPLAISADGNEVAFETNAPFTTDDVNNERDVYVRNVSKGKTIFATVQNNGDPFDSGAGGQQLPALSANGKVLAFQTIAPFNGHDSGMDFDVFERTPLK